MNQNWTKSSQDCHQNRAQLKVPKMSPTKSQKGRKTIAPRKWILAANPTDLESQRLTLIWKLNDSSLFSFYSTFGSFFGGLLRPPSLLADLKRQFHFHFRFQLRKLLLKKSLLRSVKMAISHVLHRPLGGFFFSSARDMVPFYFAQLLASVKVAFFLPKSASKPSQSRIQL